MNIRDEAKAFLVEQKGNWQEIAKETGIEANWISRFVCGRLKDPRVSKFEIILAYAEQNGWKRSQPENTAA